MNGEKVTENVYLCPDGVYRWVYEFPMLKNPAILFTVWRVLLMSCAICVLLVGVPSLFTGGLVQPLRRLQALRGGLPGAA